MTGPQKISIPSIFGIRGAPLFGMIDQVISRVGMNQK